MQGLAQRPVLVSGTNSFRRFRKTYLGVQSFRGRCLCKRPFMSIYVNIVTFSLVIMITFVCFIMHSIFHFQFPVLLEHTNRYYRRGTFFNFEIVTTKIYLFIFTKKNFDRQLGPSRFYLPTEEKSIILRQSTHPSNNDVLKASLKLPFIFSNLFFGIVVVCLKNNSFKRAVKAFSQIVSEPSLHLLQILFISSRNRAKKFKEKKICNVAVL